MSTRNDLKLGLDYIAWKNGPGRNLFNFLLAGEQNHEKFIMKKRNLFTFGEQLRALREQAELTIDELAEKTNIQKRYLEWLEDERFDLLPPSVYVRGFVLHWAEACDVDPYEIILQFDRVHALILKDKRRSFMQLKSSPRFVITGRMITLVVIVVSLVAGGVYVGNQYFHVGQRPYIEITSPASLEIIVNNQWITIEGSVSNVSYLVVAGQEVSVEADGSFSKLVALNTGINIVRIEGKSKGGEEIEVMRKVILVE